MWLRRHRVLMSSLSMTLLMAVCISVDRGILVLLSAVWKQCSLDSASEDLQQGVAAKEPQPCTGTSCCWLLGEMGRVQQEGLALRKLLLGIS